MTTIATEAKGTPFAARGLSPQMLRDLMDPEGMLHPVLHAVRGDWEHNGRRDEGKPDLDLEIRDRYINVYYRGGNLMKIYEGGRDGAPYGADFHSQYIQRTDEPCEGIKRKAAKPWTQPADDDESRLHLALRDSRLLDDSCLHSAQDVLEHVQQFTARKEAMDANIRHGRGPKLERGAEQEMAGVNNADADSEYLICDIEYTFFLPDSDRVMGRIDL